MAKLFIEKKMYDEMNDILYVHFSNIRKGKMYGDDQGCIVLLRDIETDEIVGVTVFNPRSDEEKRHQELESWGIHIDLNKLVG